MGRGKAVFFGELRKDKRKKIILNYKVKFSVFSFDKNTA